MSKSPKPAKWWFAWYPVKTVDTERIVWLRKVYREWWFEKSYFENPIITKQPHTKIGD